MKRVFVLSPADCNGERARWVLRPGARSELALKLRGPEGAPLGDVFTFLSALYFRGKLAYARAFAQPPEGGEGVLVITPTRGIISCDSLIRISTLRGFARVPIHKDNLLYRRSLQRSARSLAEALGADCQVVLLGSIASGKYLDLLQSIFGARLCVPAEFIGLGDMSRGGLMLRCVREGRELQYIPAERAMALSRLPRLTRPAHDAAATQTADDINYVPPDS
jgi:hypothetical protein